jgi:hypothetical protein
MALASRLPSGLGLSATGVGGSREGVRWRVKHENSRLGLGWSGSRSRNSTNASGPASIVQKSAAWVFAIIAVITGDGRFS